MYTFYPNTKHVVIRLRQSENTDIFVSCAYKTVIYREEQLLCRTDTPTLHNISLTSKIDFLTERCYRHH